MVKFKFPGFKLINSAVLVCGILISAAILFPAPAKAANYYVSPTGNDSSSGSEGAPFKTVQKGLNSASNDGDAVYIKAGEYDLNGFAKTFTNSVSLIGDDKNTTILKNGGTLTLSAGFNVKNLTFRNYPWSVFRPYAGTGITVDGLFFDNCIFDNVPAAIADRDSIGIIKNITVKNSEFKNITSTGSVYGFELISGTEISNILIENNTFTNFVSGNLSNSIGVFIGTATYTDFESRFHDATISFNTFDTITAGVGGPYNDIEGHAILAEGSHFIIEGNMARNLNPAADHSAIYLKGSYHKIINNNVYNGGTYGATADTVGEGDISIKGDNNIGNIISGNKVTSDYPEAGIGIVTLGGCDISNNYVKKSSGYFGIYSVGSPGKIVNIKNNYAETNASDGQGIKISDTDGGEFAYNSIVTYVGMPYYLSRVTNLNMHDNLTCTGNNCGTPLPPNPTCQNTGFFCCGSCQSGPQSQYNTTCQSGFICCASCGSILISPTPTTSPVPGDVNGDGHVTLIDLLQVISKYGTNSAPEDVSKDGKVNGVDLGIVLKNFGK